MMVLRPTDVVKHIDIAVDGLRSDNTWSAATKIEDLGWNKSTYDDSMWGTTVVSSWREKDVAERTGTPAGDPSPIWDSFDSGEVYLRKKISVTFATEFSAHIQSRGSYELYIDGVMVGSNFDKEAWRSPDEYEVSSYLTPGDHLIAIKSKRSKGDSYGVMFSIRPSAGFAEETALYDDTSGLTPAKYQCPTCSYIFDSAVEGVDLYETADEWVCPDCGTDKWSFVQVDDTMDETYGDFDVEETYDTDESYGTEGDIDMDTAPILDEGTDTEGGVEVEDTTESESGTETESDIPEDETLETGGNGDDGAAVIDFDDTSSPESGSDETTESSDDMDWMDDLPEDTGDGSQ
jgi:rubredoxin